MIPKPTMIRLRVLGTVDVRTSRGEEIAALVAASKRFAVLTYLSVARPRGYRTRDELLEIFWPRQDSSRARTSLRQVLRLLRRDLGVGVIQCRGSQVRISPERIWCDATAFDEAIGEGRLDEAAKLYRGPFLHSFHFSGAGNAFEEWHRREARRLEGEAARALWALAEESEQRGDRWSSEAHWRHLVTVAPYDEAVGRRLAFHLAAHGDRAGALRVLEELSLRLDRELSLEPSVETTMAVTRVRATTDQLGLL